MSKSRLNAGFATLYIDYACKYRKNARDRKAAMTDNEGMKPTEQQSPYVGVFVDERSTVGRVPWDQVREVRGAEEMPVHNVGPLARQPTLATLL